MPHRFQHIGALQYNAGEDRQAHMHYRMLFFLGKSRCAGRHGNVFHAVDGSVELRFEHGLVEIERFLRVAREVQIDRYFCHRSIIYIRKLLKLRC